MRKTKKITEQEQLLDERLFSYIQMSGGITFKEPNYITLGDGYVRVLHLYQLPKMLDDFWLQKVFGIEDAIVTMDVHTRDAAEVKKNINKSLQEERSRSLSAKNYMEAYDAAQRQAELQEMYDELTSMGEVLKEVDFRIFVVGRNLVDLDDRCEKILKNLEGDSYLATTFLNEGKTEWMSLFEPYKIQHSKPFAFKGLPMLTEQLASGNPYSYSELIDDFGDLVGFTPSGGVVIFDEFSKTATRRHYNGLICGDMGSGKSTLLKKRFVSNATRGNYIRTFDVTGEFENLTKEFGGKIIKCDGKGGILNPLEILRGGEDDYTSYSKHIAKVVTFFQCIMPAADDRFMIDLENVLKELYKEFGLTPEEGRNITGLAASKYPTLEDLLTYLKAELSRLSALENLPEVEMALAKDRARTYDQLRSAVESLVSTYGQMFNGYTSVDNIVDEKIVTFDISDIKDLGNAFEAQMLNLVSLCWDNAVSNGQIMKKAWEKGEIEYEDVTCFLVLIDESHRWVNTKMPKILERLIVYLREARKFFAGIVFASQSVRDFVPEGRSAAHIDLIKTLFELAQYKFIFRQDNSMKGMLGELFDNALSISQIEEIPLLETGEVILSIAGDRSIRFSVWLSQDYEAEIFAGGR